MGNPGVTETNITDHYNGYYCPLTSDMEHKLYVIKNHVKVL